MRQLYSFSRYIEMNISKLHFYTLIKARIRPLFASPVTYIGYVNVAMCIKKKLAIRTLYHNRMYFIDNKCGC